VSSTATCRQAGVAGSNPAGRAKMRPSHADGTWYRNRLVRSRVLELVFGGDTVTSLAMDGILRHDIRRDLIRFALPGIVVLFLGLVACGGEGYDGLTATLWRLATGQRSASELSTANVLGLGLFVGGMTIALVALFSLKMSYSSSLVIRVDHRLVTHGLYRHIRHPLYLGVLVAISGAPVYASSWLGGLVLSVLVPLILMRIRMEEALLVEHFGDAYREYRARTRKLIPFLF